MSKKIWGQVVTNKYLLLILLVGLVIRSFGITHSLPFVFHPDEPSVVRSALEIRFNPNPGHFDWPHLYFYLNFLLYMVFGKVRALFEALGLRDSLAILWVEPDIFYILSRGLSAILGALTAFPVYLSAKRLFSSKVGLVAALIFVFLPFHVYHSHYALIDVPMTFFLAWVVYFSVSILQNHQLKHYIWAGGILGLAISTKYNAAAGALFILAAHILRIIGSKKERLASLLSFKQLVVCGALVFFGFLVGTPYALLDFKTFSISDSPRGAFWQFTNVGKTDLSEYRDQLIENFTRRLPDDFGYSVFYIFLIVSFFTLYASIVSALNPKIEFLLKHKLLFLIVPLLVIILYFSSFDKSRSHYFMLIYPAVSISVAYFVDLVMVAISRKSKNLAIMFIFLVMVMPVTLSFGHLVAFYKEDTRKGVYDFLKSSEYQTLPIIYNDPEFEDVLGVLPNPSLKGYEYVQEVPAGIVVVLYNEDKEYSDFTSQLGTYTILTEIFVLEPQHQKGPSAKVYLFGNPLAY